MLPMEPPIIADHPALDLLNTAVKIHGSDHEFLRSDEDVLRWLRRQGFLGTAPLPVFEEGTLIASALKLRDIVRAIVSALVAQAVPAMTDLNAFLACGRSHVQIVDAGDGGLRVEARYGVLTPRQVLAPIARGAADLIAHCDPSLIRQCENKDCGLFFYDRTRTGRERCGHALCGRLRQALHPNPVE